MTASNAASAPTGWLYCRGQAVSRTTYANLYTAIGDHYGAGDGSTTFNLPDMRGRFARGFNAGNAGSPDSGRTWGTANNIQGDALENHGHDVTDPGHSHNYDKVSQAGGSQGFTSGFKFAPVGTTSATTGITIADNSVSDATADANETRPDNVAFNALIKI